MRVKLVAFTGECERLVAVASKQTLSKKPFEESWESMGEEEMETWIRETLRRGHLSPWEHCVYTFYVEDVSRVLTHQLVRHRLASYSQYSQRYKRIPKGMLEPVVPPRIGRREKALETYMEALRRAEEAYNKLVEMGIPPEDARYILPQAVKTKIVVTMNARELLHFIGLRACTKAQWEIRALAWAIWKILYRVHPRLWKWAGPRCVLFENNVRKNPVTLDDMTGGLDTNERPQVDIVQERCPETVPAPSIPTCIKAGYNEVKELIEKATS